MSQQAMRVFSTEFKEATVLRLQAGERLSVVADELKIRRKLLCEWGQRGTVCNYRDAPSNPL